MSSMKTGDNHDQAVTVVVSRRVRKGCEEQFEQLSTAMSNSAATFPGHLGSTLLRPASLMIPNIG